MQKILRFAAASFVAQETKEVFCLKKKSFVSLNNKTTIMRVKNSVLKGG